VEGFAGCDGDCFGAEKDEEGTKLLQSVKVVTAKTGSTVALSE